MNISFLPKVSRKLIFSAIRKLIVFFAALKSIKLVIKIKKFRESKPSSRTPLRLLTKEQRQVTHALAHFVNSKLDFSKLINTLRSLTYQYGRVNNIENESRVEFNLEPKETSPEVHADNDEKSEASTDLKDIEARVVSRLR